MTIKYILIAAVLALCPACMTSLTLPASTPKPGMAVIKGGTVFIAPISAQYSYIIGVDGVMLPTWSGSKDVTPGRHKFAFGASHAAGLKSFTEVTLTVKEGKQYVVEAKNWTEPNATYTVYELPGRIEVYRSTAPLVATGEYKSGEKIKAMLIAKGWRTN
jgi:hypothetical protein